METYRASDLRGNLDKVLECTLDADEAIQIIFEKGDAFLVSGDQWRSLQETLYLTSIPGYVEKIKAARAEPREGWITLAELDPK